MENKYTNTKWYNFLYILVKLDTKFVIKWYISKQTKYYSTNTACLMFTRGNNLKNKITICTRSVVVTIDHRFITTNEMRFLCRFIASVYLEIFLFVFLSFRLKIHSTLCRYDAFGSIQISKHILWWDIIFPSQLDSIIIKLMAIKAPQKV